MTPQVFLDTNVVLDFALNRPEFVKEAESIFELKDKGKIDIHISALTLSNVAYFADKHKLDAFVIVGMFINWINIIDLKTTFFNQVIDSDFLDFEDGLQYYSALNVKGITAIVTRNTKDFRSSSIPVLTPAQFLHQLSDDSE
ncbi:MAG: type II toxin-antitoxin system VapC family toxin [Cyclobacteriaceae bacterium]|jgi:predicted nucleic acid-binding protein|nr:PIN domain-containing protein [Flammeovirgaceae bacterium]